MEILVGLLIALAATPLAARIARRLDVVDRPGDLKIHDRPVPYLGGVAVAIAVAPVLVAVDPWLLAPLGAALTLGVADDVTDLAPKMRITAEIALGGAAGAVAPAGGGAVGVVATMVAVVVLINAVNLLDGIDGLATGVAVASVLGLALVSNGDAESIALALLGALLGFLVFNRPPARIYLGDGGAYLIGTALAVLMALAFDERETVSAAFALPMMVAVPIADTTIAIVRRLVNGRPLFAGDRGHVYDQLIDRGWPLPATSAALVGVQALISGVALVVVDMTSRAAVVTTIGLVAAATVIVGLAGFVRREPECWTG